MSVSYKYVAEAIALVGIAYALIKWAGRNLRSLIADRSYEQTKVAGIVATGSSSAAEALVRQGVVTSEQLLAMTPREREFLLASAGRRVDPPPRPASATPRRGVTPVALPVVSGKGAAPSPRLHLITPSRPPLGVSVHCPGCGAPLDREALQKFGATSCGRCKRPVSAHIQRGRLTVIIEETPEEAAYRERVDGTGR